MQFKLLNFHKILSNFATTLVGAFIPLIIYKATGSIILAMVYLFSQCLSRLICNHIFKKAYEKYPQLFLFLRIIPLLIYNIFILFIEKYMVLSLILIIISYGMNLSFKNNAQEILFNYSSSQKKSDKNLTITRALTNGSLALSTLAGGLFLDFNQTALIIISLALYLISVLPILVYYIFNRRKQGFNKDFVSNAVLAYNSDEVMNKKTKSVGRSLIINYFLMYTIFCVIDNFTNMYSLFLFIDVPTFAKAGYINALYYGGETLSLLAIPFITKKMDIYKTTSVCAVLAGACLIAIPFIKNYAAIYVLFGLFGFTYEVCSYYMMQSIMAKSRIAGVANSALLARQDGIMVGQMLGSLFVMCVGSIMPVFFFMLASMVGFSIYFPVSEEKMRKKLVNYLQNNEIE